MIDEKLIKALATPVPRYTSYPTAPNFTQSVGVEEYRRALGEIRTDTPLSLYIHIPFCRELCWYCGCNTKATRQQRPVTDYLKFLHAEIDAVCQHLSHRPRVRHIHFGGGSPNLLSDQQFTDLMKHIRDCFEVDEDAEVAVEIDPRWLEPALVVSFADNGVNRVSIGVQDFDPAVQRAINRYQSYDATKAAIDALRSKGIAGINVDLVYGLPHQTRRSLAATVKDVLKLAPDRVALFGYAHLPERLRHQKMIDSFALPDVVERFGQSQRARRILTRAGFKTIGMDHFARPSDPLANAQLHRNFQGYTTDDSSVLVGFGASSISSLPSGYFQNTAWREMYQRCVAKFGIATTRGIKLSKDDIVRGYVIERLMCDFEFSSRDLREQFGTDVAVSAVIADAADLVSSEMDGLISATDDGFIVTPSGRPFVRSIASCFDAYLYSQSAAYSLAV